MKTDFYLSLIYVFFLIPAGAYGLYLAWTGNRFFIGLVCVLISMAYYDAHYKKDTVMRGFIAGLLGEKQKGEQ